MSAKVERSPKVKSLLVDPKGAANIKQKYDEIYRSPDVWLYKKSHGVHSVVLTLIRDALQGKRFLDIGCGAGRLAIMASHFAAESMGIDFSEAAVALARLNAACAGGSVEFAVADLDHFCEAAARPFDVAAMVGVLEHVPDPAATLRWVHGIISPGGLLVVTCPNFINPRGWSYMTLLTLLHLPMSLADLRQVDVMQMREWCEATGFSLAGTAGAIYRFGWDLKAAEDMIRRVPLAVQDAELAVPFDHETYNAWLRRMVAPNREVLEWLESQGVLKRIERRVEVVFRRQAGIDDALWEKMVEYIHEDISSDPYYSTVPPFAHMGAECLYLLKKQG